MTSSAQNTPTSTAEKPPFVQLEAVSKAFSSSAPRGQDLEVLRDFNMRLNEGELVTIFGPNGCGKTTILNILAGLATPDAGHVIVRDGQQVGPVGYVFQNYADTLLPWRTVRDNIALPLEFRGLAELVRRANVRDWLNQFHLNEHADKYIYELSGGLKQLVAIARATVYQPRLLLLDEPFSALDYSLSRMLWLRFREYWTDRQVTTVFVSHNVDEAIFLGDRLFILSPRPARVVAEIPIPLGANRSLQLLTSSQFFALRSQVLQAFEEGKLI